MPVLSIRNLSHSYGRRKVLGTVDLDLRSAQITVLIGPNGVGKTTLLKLASGLLKPERGDIQRAPDGISLFLPDGQLYDALTLRENLAVYGKLCGGEAPHAPSIVSQMVGEDLLDQQVRYLSRGQRARGALCRALSMPAALYLLDEPLSGLDESSIDRLLQVLRWLRDQGKSILVVTHQLDRMRDTADRVVRLEGGRLLMESHTQDGHTLSF